MNRYTFNTTTLLAKHLPHTRGDEPDADNYAKEDYVHLPHTRGDEPLAPNLFSRQQLHLPHTRGDEPDVDGHIYSPFPICPTRVGMNRRI